MRIPTYLHRNSYDIYYFRIAIPLKFRHNIRRTEIKRSLRTTSYSVALRRAQNLKAEVFRLFEEVAMDFDDPKYKLYKGWKGGNMKIDLGEGRSLQLENFEVDPDNPKDVEAFNAFVREATGATAAQLPSSIEPPAILFSELVGEYIKVRKQKKKNFRSTTEKDYRKAAERFIEILEDRPVNYYTFQDADNLQDTLHKIPKNWKKNPKYRDLTLHEIVKQKLPDSAQQSDRTVNKLLTVIAGMFGLAAMRGYSKLNPFADKQVILENSPDEEWLPFGDEDLEKIFDTSTFKHEKRFPNRFFGPLLAVFSGARINEICQLKRQDIGSHGGFSCIRFTDEGDDQSLKGRNSKRVIPIHPELIRLGFLDYCDKLKPADMLFPELTLDAEGKWDRKLRRWCNETYLIRIGVKREKLSFRSFRRTFATKLRAAKVEETYAAELMGHMTGKGSFMSWKTYASRGEVPPLIEALEKLQFKWSASLKPWPWK